MSDFAFLAEQIHYRHSEFERTQREAIAHAIAAGELLNEAKRQVGHGGWLDWMNTNLDFGARTAQRYMRMARNASALTDMDTMTAALAELADPTPRVPHTPLVDPDGHRRVGVRFDELLRLIADHRRGMVDTAELYDYALRSEWRWL